MKAGSSGRTRRLAGLAVVGAGALVIAGVAAADREKIRLTAAGQSAARDAVLIRPDLGTASGWTGGLKKPDLSSALPCKSYQPKQSDLVLVGAAKSVWSNAALRFESEAQVLQTPEMVRLDWQRTVLAPQVVPCLRAGLATQLGPSTQLVSFGRIGFPHVAAYTRAYRTVIDVKASTATVRVMVDSVLVGRGHTEIALTVSAPLVDQSVVRPAELRLAHLLVSRIRT